MNTKKRSRLFAGGSVLTAAAAIGVGAIVSSGAMASTEQPVDADVIVGMVSVDGSGEAFSCSWTDEEAPALVGPVEEAEVIPVGDVPVVDAGGAVGVGEVIPAEPLPDGAEVEYETIDLSVDPEALAAIDDAVAAVDAFDVAELREGTDEECQDLLDSLTLPAPASTEP